MISRIIFCTLRDNRGATGGPGGVLFLQKSILGNKIKNFSCDYQFNMITLRLGPVKIPLNKILFYIKFRKIKDAYFFTHDIDTGDLLARMGKKYSIIYHHQGPLVEELTNFGKKLSQHKINQIAQKERNAFIHAQTVHFPSKGAADMYFSSKNASCSRNEVKISNPLYNIIPQVNPVKPDNLNLIYDEKYITLFSLGTLTIAKGQDQTVKFIKEFAKVSSKPIRYILVGKGPLKDKLFVELNYIKKEIPTFSYIYFDSLPHSTIMYIHKISDIYIMLHRISIFDFATLEAMSQSSAIILSKVGGNLDFNKENNIIYAEDINNNYTSLNNIDIDSLKKRNFNVFRKFFSREAFIKQYENLFDRKDL